MIVFKNIRFEIIIFSLVTIFIFLSNELDLLIKNFFDRLNDSPIISKSSLFGNIYLEMFFINITELGNSFWYFSLILFLFIIFFINKKSRITNYRYNDQIIKFSFYSFVYLFCNGLLTQILKHLIGRARPNHATLDGSFEFYFLNIESNFHSFPSGHSSTIFMVCFILCALMPRLKYLFFLCALIVSLSRVVVNAHYFTDVVGGMVLALIIYKGLNLILEKRYSFKEIKILKDFDISNMVVFLLIVCLFVTIAPSIDIYLAGLFYRGAAQFLLQESYVVSILFRDILLPCILVYILIFPILSRYKYFKAIFLGYVFSFKEIVLIWLSQFLILLVFVNSILKTYWGRVRPEDILQLGGVEQFTPWYTFSNVCSSNCSFVSGDSSVGFSFVIIYLITKRVLNLYLCIIFGLAIGIVRMSAGAHFLSDIIFAGLFVVVLNLVIYHFYKKLYAK